MPLNRGGEGSHGVSNDPFYFKIPLGTAILDEIDTWFVIKGLCITRYYQDLTRTTLRGNNARARSLRRPITLVSCGFSWIIPEMRTDTFINLYNRDKFNGEDKKERERSVSLRHHPPMGVDLLVICVVARFPVLCPDPGSCTNSRPGPHLGNGPYDHCKYPRMSLHYPSLLQGMKTGSCNVLYQATYLGCPDKKYGDFFNRGR
jgi:hypothetical protein